MARGDIRLADLIGSKKGDIVTIIGTGGKTSLLWRLAWEHRREKVLVTTTTKMGPLEPPGHDQIVTSDTLKKNGALPGITLAGDTHSSGKLKILRPGLLEQVVPYYDLILIEGDGSKRRPCKGWADYEPVIPAGTDITIGVMPLRMVGEPVSDETVLRMKEFCRISGARVGDEITLAHIAGMVSHSDGMMNRATGRKILLLNCYNQRDIRLAKGLISLLPEMFLAGMDCIITGDIHKGTGEIAYKKTASTA